MLIVLPFNDKDKALAVLLAEWIRDLGGVHRHQCLLVHHASTPAGEVIDPLRAAFHNVVAMPLRDADPKSWPQGPNLMFRRAALQIHHLATTQPATKTPWLWMEPDAIPLKASWLDEIEAEYTRGRRPFMGAAVNHPNTPVHMTGIAVYPHDAPIVAPLLVTCEAAAFDMNAKGETLPRMHPTNLIQHEWRPAPFATVADLERLQPHAAIYHQDKDGGLIRLLRTSLLDPATWEPEPGSGIPCPYGTCPPSGCLIGTPHGCCGPEGEPGIDPAALASASPSPVQPVSEGPTPGAGAGGLPAGAQIALAEAETGDDPAAALAKKLFEQAELVDMHARLEGKPPEFTDATREMVDRMTRHLALIAKDPAGRRAVLAQLGMAGLRAELPSVTTPPAKRGRKKGKK